MAKILLTYSSGYGTTREVAAVIAGIFEKEYQIQVVLQPIDHPTLISDYDAIVIGSSIRADNLPANTRDFFALHHKELLKIKTAVFMVCLTASTPEGKAKVKREYLSVILDKYPDLHPIGIEAFGGKVDFNNFNPVMQQLVKSVMIQTGVSSEQSVDMRNWQEIQQWARAMAEKINGAS